VASTASADCSRPAAAKQQGAAAKRGGGSFGKERRPRAQQHSRNNWSVQPKGRQHCNQHHHCRCIISTHPPNHEPTIHLWGSLAWLGLGAAGLKTPRPTYSMNSRVVVGMMVALV
jgi:hypothetical protein